MLCVLFVMIGTTLFSIVAGRLAEAVVEARKMHLERKQLEELPGPDRELELVATGQGLHQGLHTKTSFRAQHRKHLVLLSKVGQLIFVLLIGATVFFFDAKQAGTEDNHGEKVNFLDAIYVAVITASSVGFGDFSPQSDWCKIIFIFYMPVGLVCFSRVMFALVEIPFSQKADALLQAMKQVFGQRLDYQEFKLLTRVADSLTDDDAEPVCTRDQYILHMLTKAGKITPADIQAAGLAFDDLDVDGNSVLDISDVRELQREDGVFDLAHGERWLVQSHLYVSLHAAICGTDALIMW
eukprot:SAG31_NODE_6237_length_2107_cov_2.461155_1_plen_296_part_00